MRLQLYERADLPSLLDLVNIHLSAAVPGWALTGTFLSEHLTRNTGEFVTDPWVSERTTLCAKEGHRVTAAAHLLRYGAGLEVGEHLRDTGEIDWFVFLPDHESTAAEVLSRTREVFATWGVAHQRAFGAGLPKLPLLGIPESWPHVAWALDAAGYEPTYKKHRGALYGGRLDGVSAPGEPPVPGITVRRTVGLFGVRFTALLDGEEVGLCECVVDLDAGGALPALGGWAELSEMRVAEEWRNRRVGSWLVGEAVDWLRLCRRDRIILVVDEDDERAGAGRFYRRFGWRVLTREIEARPEPYSSLQNG